MPTDLSKRRSSFKPAYRAVQLQQGRQLLDTDWNEEVILDQWSNRARITDEVGPTGAPKAKPGFAVDFQSTDAAPFMQQLVIQPGRIYVEGLLCELDDIFYQAVNLEPGNYLIYLEAWQQEVNYLQDPALQEVALGEADTSVRLQTVWKIDVHQVEEGEDPAAAWEVVRQQYDGTLSARLRPAQVEESPCELPPTLGYHGQENQLYRIEIHRGGTDADQPPTFKWSRDNGTVQTLIERSEPGDLRKIQVESLGKDEVLGFAGGQWVEITEMQRAADSKPGQLRKITEIFPAASVIQLDEQVAAMGEGFLLRRWDQNGAGTKDGQLVEADWLDLEAGIQVKFSPGRYRAGDYWLIPARQLTRNIEWPVDPVSGEPQDLKPHGPERHYAKLGVLTIEAGRYNSKEGRAIFPPLTHLMAKDIRYKSSNCPGMADADTVQKALHLLYMGRANAYTYLVTEEEEDWPAVFNRIGEGDSAHIHFREGTYELTETILVKAGQHLKITGCGPATKINGRNIESCLIFEDCASVLVRDMAISTEKTVAETALYAPLIPNGTLIFLECDYVHIESTRLKCGWGTQPKLSCVSVRNELFKGRITIRQSEFLVGYLQEGIYFNNPILAHVENNHLEAYDCSDAVSFEQLLEDPVFLEGVRRYLILKPSFSSQITGSDTDHPYPQLGRGFLRLTDSTGQNRTIRYRALDGLIPAWDQVITDHIPEEASQNEQALAVFVQEMADRILTEAEFRAQGGVFTAFSKFYEMLAAQPIRGGSIGIRVHELMSSRIRDLNLSNNIMDGLLRGIDIRKPAVTISIDGSPVKPNEGGTISIVANTIRTILPPVIHDLEVGAVFVRHYQRILIEKNQITLQRQLGQLSADSEEPSQVETPVSGIRTEGPFGKTMIVSHNRLVGMATPTDSDQALGGTLSFNWGIAVNVSDENMEGTPPIKMIWAVRWNTFPGSRPNIENIVNDVQLSSYTPTIGTVGERIVSKGVILESNVFSLP